MTYDYVCTACSHVWEAEQRITEDPLKDCPQCHEQTAKRQISGGQGFILKGGGWYSDLYSSAKPGVGTEATQESKTQTKAEAAPAACASGACGTSACPAVAATTD